jgi:hypothetical protein
VRATCPDCGAQGHISTFFADDDGKRFAAVLAGMVPELGRATIAYLGLFKPPKTALRMARAVKIAHELEALANAGSVCRDERSGVRRACTPTTWAAGIEQMLQQRSLLTLPLENHNYLRAVVFGLADKADAAVERRREADARAGRHLETAPSTAKPAAISMESKLENQLAWIGQQISIGAMTVDEANEERRKAREKYRSPA